MQKCSNLLQGKVVRFSPHPCSAPLVSFPARFFCLALLSHLREHLSEVFQLSPKGCPSQDTFEKEDLFEKDDSRRVVASSRGVKDSLQLNRQGGLGAEIF